MCRIRGMYSGILLLLFAWPACLQATMLLRAEVVPDGSIDPPGDRIDLVLAFFPGEAELTVTVRGFLAAPERGISVPLPARDLSSGKPISQWTQTVQVPPPKGGAPARISIPVPFATLRLNRGLHRIGFEVTGTRGESVDFVQPMPLTNLQVTGDVRREMSVPLPPTKLETKTQAVPAYIFKDGKLQQIEATTAAPEPVFDDTPQREVRVQIAGELTHPLFAEAPPGLDQIDEEVAMALPPPGAGWSSAKQFVPEPKRSILFATNRGVVDPGGKTTTRFGNTAVASLSYGVARVNIPVEVHKKGNLETPGYWSYADPEKHFLVEALDPLTLEKFRESIQAEDVLLYVHGYNTTMELALLRGAQLQHDLEFPGKGVVFSWPSQGTLRGYSADEDQAAKSAKGMAALIHELSTADVGQIHVISHSMGNRVFLSGLREWELSLAEKPERKVLGQVMLAAPDVDAATFAALIPTVVRHATRATLYYCPHDAALMTSQTLHLNKPVGLGPFFFEGLDTINAEKVDTSYLGHGYYAAARELLLDLRLTIGFGQAPDQRRPPLGARSSVYGFPLWAVVPIY